MFGMVICEADSWFGMVRWEADPWFGMVRWEADQWFGMVTWDADQGLAWLGGRLIFCVGVFGLGAFGIGLELCVYYLRYQVASYTNIILLG